MGHEIELGGQRFSLADVAAAIRMQVLEPGQSTTYGDVTFSRDPADESDGPASE